MRRIIKRDLELVKFKNRCQIKRYFITRGKTFRFTVKKKFKKTIHASYISTISNKMAENPFHQWNQSKKPSPYPLISNNSHFELSKLDKANSNESHERNEWRERDTNNTKRGAERKFSRQDSAKRCVSINQSSNEREFHAETRLPSRSVSTWK